MASEASYVYILSGQKLMKNGPFLLILEHLTVVEND